MCKTCPRNDRKKSAVIVRLGMTVVELMMVLAILGILTSIAVSAYSSYRVSEYDNEAIATLNDLYAQATQSIAEWGVGEDEGGIQAQCFVINCNANAGRFDPGYCDDFFGGRSNVRLPAATHHWTYQLCFGYIDVVNRVEGFLISAHRITDGDDERRVILYGTGIESPIVESDVTGRNINDILPEGARLQGVGWNANII